MTEIFNDSTRVRINELGAEIKSIVFGGSEYIWHGDEKYWGNSAPILFPICGRLKDNTYYCKGKEYHLNIHGFAMFSLFTVIEKSDVRVTLSLKSDEKSRLVYPFDFELRVTFELVGNKLVITNRVINNSDETVYFSVGSHEGYYCPDGIEDYDIIFEKDEALESFGDKDGLVALAKFPVQTENGVLPMKYEYFASDSLVFEKLKSKEIILKNRKTGHGVKVHFEDFDYMVIWTLNGAPYLCIEPWCGMGDFEDTDQELTHKRGIKTVAKSEQFERVHSIELF